MIPASFRNLLLGPLLGRLSDRYGAQLLCNDRHHSDDNWHYTTPNVAG